MRNQQEREAMQAAMRQRAEHLKELSRIVGTSPAELYQRLYRPAGHSPRRHRLKQIVESLALAAEIGVDEAFARALTAIPTTKEQE